ncbi:MAG: 1-deoxy-D-xylulose-5-phosphate synthase [Candidatus Omnitrophica bacterium]|nr:1-deoxy-D-xylulose-5-phosphate synthase [Candidatus Omnitrophota bacterium]
MPKIYIIPKSEFDRVRDSQAAPRQKLSLIADMCRVNTLAGIKLAGSGHIGSSFSSLDIVTYLYYAEMNVTRLGLHHPARDIYFSSKGHDVPGLYSVLFSLGILPEEKFLKLRRLGGLPGHPDVQTPGIEANTGSLGMGISKAKGMAFAQRMPESRQGRSSTQEPSPDPGRIFVMTGDGELQEGQNYEALQTAVHQKLNNITVIVDHNKIQSDRLVEQTSDLGDIAGKFAGFGWHVRAADGHDFKQLEKVFSEFRRLRDKPKILIANTLKGRGVSFMENPEALTAGRGFYKWHSGAPDDEAFLAAHEELTQSLNQRLRQNRLAPLNVKIAGEANVIPAATHVDHVGKAFGRALTEIAGGRNDIVVLDSDLLLDCHLQDFALKYPGRFIENGIAEQDMVSMAGGLALEGFLPVVNSFSAFLTSRANEQIYTNACEKTKIIYAAHYAGLLPAGPGASHQSLRDISLLGAIPNCVIAEPANEEETRRLLKYFVDGEKQTYLLRLQIGPSPAKIDVPDHKLHVGQGTALAKGQDALLFAYGPVMLHEALQAHERLKEKSISLEVVDFPWLNRVDANWLGEIVRPHSFIYVLDNHSSFGGLGDAILNALSENRLTEGRRFKKFGVEGFPACGSAGEVLKYHKLDAASLAEAIFRH